MNMIIRGRLWFFLALVTSFAIGPTQAQNRMGVIPSPFPTFDGSIDFLHYAVQRTAGAMGLEAIEYAESALLQGLQSGDTISIKLLQRPTGGYELLVEGPTEELLVSEVHALTSLLATELQGERDANLSSRLRYHIQPLSYVQSDRALAVLKAMGYTVTEFEETSGASNSRSSNGPPGMTSSSSSSSTRSTAQSEKIFDVKTSIPEGGESGLPRIIKMLDAPKTSITDPAPGASSSSSTGRPQSGGSYNQSGAQLPGLGGTYLHQTTSGEPLQRLLIEYDPDEPALLERLLQVLQEQIDVPARQIVIEAMVIEVNTDRVNELGIQAEYQQRDQETPIDGTGDSRSYTDVGGAINQVVDGAFRPFTFALNTLTGSTDRAAAERFLGVELNALIKEGAAEIMSRPSVLALDGRQARIQIGQQVPVVSSNVSQGTIQGQISYSEVGITLNLRPRINQDGDEITMQVETIVSSVTSQSTGQNTTGTEIFRAPTFDSRRVETFVRVANNTPFIIGGLISTEKVESWTGVPFLSKIPLLGRLFRSTTTGTEKREVIVVLTPHLVRNDGNGLSYVIPKDADRFNSIGNDLFRNAYRIRDDDVFDFTFVTESRPYLKVKADALNFAQTNPVHARVQNVIEGHIPGEDILVRRMIWEIIFKNGYADHVDEEKVIFFSRGPDGSRETTYLSGLRERQATDTADNATLVTYVEASESDTSFDLPTATIRPVNVPNENYLAALPGPAGMQIDTGGTPWNILIADEMPPGVRGASSWEVLKAVLVLQRVLALNEDLTLSLEDFKAGRRIVVPNFEDLEQRYIVADLETARYFYEIVRYYDRFEEVFGDEMATVQELVGSGSK